MSTDDPAYLNPGEGRTYQMGRITLTFKANEDAGYSICETVDAPGGTGAALHRHPAYQETHIVIEGEYEFQIGDEIVRLGLGGMAFVPNGIVHGVRKISEGISRQLLISTLPQEYSRHLWPKLLPHKWTQAMRIVMDR